MANDTSSKVCLAPGDELLCDSTLSDVVGNVTNPALSEVHRQESGIFESSSDFSDNCFSDNDIEWHSCDEDEGVTEDNDNLWEEFQQCTFWSPACSINQSKCYTPPNDRVVEEEIAMVKLSPSRHKKVTFKPDKELVTIHRMITWDYAYRACRRGPWEQMAQDRGRFARRIEEVALVLEPCLKKLINQIPLSD